MGIDNNVFNSILHRYVNPRCHQLFGYELSHWYYRRAHSTELYFKLFLLINVFSPDIQRSFRYAFLHK